MKLEVIVSDIGNVHQGANTRDADRVEPTKDSDPGLLQIPDVLLEILRHTLSGALEIALLRARNSQMRAERMRAGWRRLSGRPLVVVQ